MTLINRTSTSFIRQPVHVEVALQHHPVLQAVTLMLFLSLLSSTAILSIRIWDSFERIRAPYTLIKHSSHSSFVT